MNNTLQTESTSKSQPRRTALLERVPASIYIDLLLILVLVLVAFGRTLTSYFLADDFGEIRYLHRMCTTDHSLLLANFTGNYMQIPGMSVYRPFLLMSLLIDFIVWKANAAGFYTTNLLFYFFDAALLYLIVLQLASTNSKLRNRLTALSAASLFALSPLHCESVSWVLGRVDIVSAFFYEVSFLTILLSRQAKSRMLTGIAIGSFISGLLVKEMAIGIPVIAFLVGWLYTPGQKRESMVVSLKNALAFSWPYLAATVLYFIVRFLCLGTLVGGYVAGFGASQEQHALARWLDKDTIERIAFPLVQNHFQSANILCTLLLVLYCLLFANLAVRLLARQFPLKLMVLLGGWFLTTLLPIYKLWGIGYNLEGARFLFFFTMPLSTLLAAALFQNDESEEKVLDRSLLSISCAVAIGLSATFGYIAAKTDLIWVNAGKEVKATALSAREILRKYSRYPAIFLGIPKESQGTHMILNGDTFKASVSKPFANDEPRRSFATFDPVMYSPEYKMNSQRLKNMVANGAETFVWSSEKRQFDRVEFGGGSAESATIIPSNAMQGLKTGGKSGFMALSDQGLVFDGNDGTGGIQLSQLNLNPLKADFAVIEMKAGSTPEQKRIEAFLSTKDDAKKNLVSLVLPEFDRGQFQKVYVPLSANWKWFEKPSINELFLTMPSGNSTVRSVKLLEQDKCCPQVTAEGVNANENGTYILEPDGKPLLTVDASNMENVSSLVVEIGKANYFFDNFRDSQSAIAVDKKLPFSGIRLAHSVSRSDFAGAGFFQIRVIALDEKGKQVGAPSACLNFLVH